MSSRDTGVPASPSGSHASHEAAGASSPSVSIPNARDKTILYCSFCGKSQYDVVKLIAGPTVFICDECVRLCVDICSSDEIDVGVDAIYLARCQAFDAALAVLKDVQDTFDGLVSRVAVARENLIASGIEARSGETPQAARPEGQEPGAGTADATPSSGDPS